MVAAPPRPLTAFVLTICTAMPAGHAIAQEAPTKAPNVGGVINTRHNMTQSFLGVGANWMSLSRNDYGEVCVYCHTPHGANRTVSAPLWNRTMRSTTYTTYDQLNTSTLTQPVTQPGINSLTCLSCHDGQTAIDSVINMPGSGRYDAAQETTQNNAFLDTWPGGPGSSAFGGHGTLDNSPGAMSQFGACQSCHSVDGDQHDPSTMAPFDVFYISTDLRDDHPVGVLYPNTNSDFNDSAIVDGSVRVFDTNGNARADASEIRLYDTGDGYEVECASCHDPHGVPSGGAGSTINPTFLRITNAGSAVCLTCHIK